LLLLSSRSSFFKNQSKIEEGGRENNGASCFIASSFTSLGREVGKQWGPGLFFL
jgi:hypothetical protein